MKRSKQEIQGRLIVRSLRHDPGYLGLTLEPGGWVLVSDLIKAMQKHDYFSLDDLKEIVKTNDKQRLSFSKNGEKIRANQGHSVEVDLQLEQAVPPNILWHGTADANVKSIKRNGLNKQGRHAVHLSADRETAIAIGKRHGTPFVFGIRAGEMHKAGYVFSKSENGVWLTEVVPVAFLMSDPYCQVKVDSAWTTTNEKDCGSTIHDVINGLPMCLQHIEMKGLKK